jgi:flagellar motor switch protein FliM
MNLDSLRGLERVHDDTCVALSTTLSGHAGRPPVDVDCVFVDQVYYDHYRDYLQKRSCPGPVCSFALPPLEGRAVLEVRGPLMEYLTGTMAAVESSVTEALESILHDLQTALAPIQSVVLTDLVQEPDTADVRVAAADSLAAVVAVQIDRPEWWMTFCYPRAMLEPLRARLESSPRPL